MSDWPTYAKQQKICKRGDTVMCMAAGAPGCELCMPCRYSDEEIAARKLPVDDVRARHARDVEGLPLMCAGCFNDRPRDIRERQVMEHLVGLYGKKPQEEIEFLRREIGQAVASFPDTQLAEARDWTNYE